MRFESLAAKPVLLGLIVLAVGVACTSGPAEAQAPPAKPAGEPAPTVFGENFVAGSFDNVNRQAGGPAAIDLDAALGAKPVVLYYWIAGNTRADKVFVELQELVFDTGRDKLDLFGVVFKRTERDEQAIADRVVSLGIRVPVLNDTDFALGKRLQVRSVPNVTIFDAEGRLRLTNGASLLQQLEYNIDLAGAVRRVAETGSLGTYGYLEAYHPVEELVGQKCPDFEAPLLDGDTAKRWSNLLADDKVNVLIFWSVDCPHCRQSLPEINEWLKANGEGVNVISAAKVTNEATRIKTREFCEYNGFVFPTLVDQDLQIADLYSVTSTPTILFIRPDGVIDSVATSAGHDFGKLVEAKKKSML
ncbi:MAG TPA: TlpA family protein disulfide reductase [Candidatus Polarisedimenticolaceae bacterium]|nr:TlpA family protein disulfide reductase [Candidatus Polarisedimenticolaceae bacterium]